MSAPQLDNQALREAAQNLAEAEQVLRAVGILLAAAAFTLGDQMAAKAEVTRAKRRARRKPKAPTPPKTV